MVFQSGYNFFAQIAIAQRRGDIFVMAKTFDEAAAEFVQDLATDPVQWTRPTWEETFFDMLTILAKRATCPRLQTAAIVVDSDHRVLGMGYNGSPKGMPHCTDNGCLMDYNHCISAVHAEANALARVDPRLAKGASLYILHRPCLRCIQMMINYQIKEIFFWGVYDTDDATMALHLATLSGMGVYCLAKGN